MKQNHEVTFPTFKDKRTFAHQLGSFFIEKIKTIHAKLFFNFLFYLIFYLKIKKIYNYLQSGTYTYYLQTSKKKTITVHSIDYR